MATIDDQINVMGGGGLPSPGIAAAQMAPASPAPAKSGGHSNPLSSFVHLVQSVLGNAPGQLAANAIEGKKASKPTVPAAGSAAPTSAGVAGTSNTSANPGAVPPIVDPMALHLFFSQIIGPYLDKIVGEQNQSADTLGAQMNHALSDFSLPPEAKALLQARIPEEQADIRNVAETQRAAVASAPDLAAFMQTIQKATTEQEQARLEQARALAAQNTSTSSDPAVQALINSLTQ